jgi:hypothetical protein
MPKKPNLPPEVLAKFELYGVDMVRYWLQTSSYIAGVTSDTGENLGVTSVTGENLGNAASIRAASIRRGEMQDWLKWKAEVATRRVKVGVYAFVVAAVFAVLGVVVSRELALV